MLELSYSAMRHWCHSVVSLKVMTKLITLKGQNHSFDKMNLVNLPILNREPSLHVPSKCLTRLRVPPVLEIVVAYRELSVWFLDIRVVYNTDVATSENRPLFRIAGNGKLSQIQVKLLSQVHWKDERSHRLICCPVFFCRVPGQRSVPSYDFAVLCFQDSQGMAHVVAPLVEVNHWECMFAGPIQQLYMFEGRLGEEWLDIVVVSADFALKTRNFAACCRYVGADGHHFVFFGALRHVQILYLIECGF